MEHHIIYDRDEKDQKLGLTILTHQNLKIFITAETDKNESLFNITLNDKLIYSIVANVINKYMICLILEKNGRRILLLNGYQVLTDKYKVNTKIDIIVPEFLKIHKQSFNSKEWKKQESDYEYVMAIAKKDDMIKNTLQKCGLIL